MAIIIKLPSFLIGIPDPMPRIPGFEIVAYPDEWLLARQGEKMFIVEQFPLRYRLSPWVKIGGKNCGHFDQAINIPREDL